MPRNIEDIVVPERRKSIRNIPIPNDRRRGDPRYAEGSGEARKIAKLDGLKKPARLDGRSGGRTPVEEAGGELPPSPPSPPRFEMPRRPRSSRRRIWAALGVATLVIIFAALSFFNGATLSYAPRSVALAFDNEVYTARKTADSGLLYSVVKLSGEKSVSVPASGEREVERKASGTIIVYNDASSESQRLVENTRFESPVGKIYRIQNAITIPGKKGSMPGSLEVTVYADEPGGEFNTGLVDWTVPGLKGTSRYTTIYARSKTPMTGGFVGKEKAVSEADLASAKTQLQTLLSEELLAKAQAEVPADFILFPALSSIVFEELVQSGSSSANAATVNLKANLYGVMFKRSDLARELSKGKAGISSSEIPPQERVELPSYDSLQISFANTVPADLLSISEVNFKVNGNANLVWVTDEASLKSDLLGRSKRDVSAVLANYPTIASASATIRPFWKSTFPEELGKVTIKKLKAE